MGLLRPQRIEWKKQNLLWPCHTFQCFQLWLSSCSFMDTNSLEQVLVVLGSWIALAFQGWGQLLPAQALKDTASENENIIYQCVFNDSERSICAFCFRLSNENVSTSVKFFYCCAHLWLSRSGCSSERGFDYMDRLPLQRYFLTLKDFWVRDRVLFEGRKPIYHF